MNAAVLRSAAVRPTAAVLPPDSVLSLRDVTKTYGDVGALRGVSL